jgi:hypothetical protein
MCDTWIHQITILLQLSHFSVIIPKIPIFSSLFLKKKKKKEKNYNQNFIQILSILIEPYSMYFSI